MARSCEGLVALVTGASQGGTGRATAIRLAAEGAKVGITARSVEGLNETMAIIGAFGGTAISMPSDLADPDGGRSTLVEQTEQAFGPIDILVNNAVAHTLKPVHEFTLSDMEFYGQVNLWAPWLLMTQVLPGMRARSRGSILNLTSFSGELPPGPPFAFKSKDGSSMYGATKAALNRLTVAAAGENEGLGVAVNALTPQTAIVNAMGSDTIAAYGDKASSSDDMFEPVETMAEAALALCTGDPNILSGRIAYSLQLLLELDRPVYDLHGEQLVEGWQPVDLPRLIRSREMFHKSNKWPDVYNFHRVHTPYPDALNH